MHTWLSHLCIALCSKLVLYSIWFVIQYEEYGVLGKVLRNCFAHAVEIWLW
jgi:hypothetical protein